MKSRKILILAALAAAFASSLLAQGAPAPRFDPETTVTLRGAVVTLKTDPGSPATLVMDDAEMGMTVVRLGPSWYLNGLGFTASEGETVEVFAAACTGCAAAYVASRVKNVTTGAIAELRDDDGLPAWRGVGRARAGSPARGWGCGHGRGAVRGGGCRGGGGCGGHHCGYCAGARS